MARRLIAAKDHASDRRGDRIGAARGIRRRPVGPRADGGARAAGPCREPLPAHRRRRRRRNCAHSTPCSTPASRAAGSCAIRSANSCSAATPARSARSRWCRSAARRVLGLLACGSHDSHRFNPTMSTDFLAHIGDLIAAALARDWMQAPRRPPGSGATWPTCGPNAGSRPTPRPPTAATSMRSRRTATARRSPTGSASTAITCAPSPPASTATGSARAASSAGCRRCAASSTT